MGSSVRQRRGLAATLDEPTHLGLADAEGLGGLD
jgi:hypothetical protein